MEYWVRELISWLTILFHTVLGQSYVIIFDATLELLEDAWPALRGRIEDYFEEREVFYGVLKAQDEGFEIIWDDEEEGFDLPE